MRTHDRMPARSGARRWSADCRSVPPSGRCWLLTCTDLHAMVFKRLAIALFRRNRRGTRVAIVPEFGARVVLREGDKLVRRNPKGEIEVTTIVRGGERGA